MTTVLDLQALQAAAGIAIPLAENVRVRSGSVTSEAVQGFSDVRAVELVVRVPVLRGHPVPSVSVTVQQSTNGSDWTTGHAFTFTATGDDSFTLDAPDDYLRVVCAPAGGLREAVVSVVASIVTVDAPDGGGGGGSQAGTPRVIKTVVDFTDLAAGTDGLTIDLLTLPVGSCVLGWWVDPDTFVNWDSQDENADGWLGQGAGWHPPHNGTLGRIITPGTSANFDSTAGETEAGSSNRRYSLAGAQSLKGSALLVTQTTDPVQVWWDTGGQPPDPATVGHSEIYFLVVEAPIPTS